MRQPKKSPSLTGQDGLNSYKHNDDRNNESPNGIPPNASTNPDAKRTQSRQSVSDRKSVRPLDGTSGQSSANPCLNLSRPASETGGGRRPEVKDTCTSSPPPSRHPRFKDHQQLNSKVRNKCCAGKSKSEGNRRMTVDRTDRGHTLNDKQNTVPRGRRSSLKAVTDDRGKRTGILTPVRFSSSVIQSPLSRDNTENPCTLEGTRKSCLNEDLPVPPSSAKRKLSGSVSFTEVEDRTASSLTSELSLTGEFREGDLEETSGDDSDNWEDENAEKEPGSDEYDTDLETDLKFTEASSDREDRHIGKGAYLEACQRAGTSPQQRFISMLAEKSLSLRNRSLGPSAIRPLCAALKDNLRVERINLEGTDIKEEGSQFVAEMLLENITITHVNLANNCMGMRGAQVMGHVITVTENITHMNLAGNKMDDKCAWYLSTGIGSNTSLTLLDLSCNDFCEKAGTLIGGSLAQNRTLRCLNLSWNKIRGKGAVAIFQGLMFNSSLEVLDLAWNGVGYEGSVALSKSLRKNVGLKELDVSNNRIDWRGADLISAGLKDNSTLTKLRIGFNPLTTTGCMDLLQAAASETSAVCLLDASEVCVLGEADLLAATISRRRKFQFQHGGIVPSHDVIGARMEREINPMLRVIEYLRVLGLRPLELLKSFDKSSSFELPRAEFIDRIKKIGVKLHKYEIDALANSVSAKGFNHDLINYRKLSMAVREVVREERERKMKEREEWRQIKHYHTQILQKGVPSPIGISKDVFGDLSERSLLRVENACSPLGSFSSRVTPPAAAYTSNEISRGSRDGKLQQSVGSLLESTKCRSDTGTGRQTRTKHFKGSKRITQTAR